MQKNQQVALTFALYQNDAFVRRQTVSQEIVRIGSGEKSDVRFEDDSVARMHCVVEATDTDEVTLIDLGNGTVVNGASVNKCQLTAGDTITVGTLQLVVETIEHAAAKRVAEAQPLAQGQAAPAAKLNPFLAGNAFRTPAFNPFKSDAVAADAVEGSYEYRMVTGQAVSPHVETDVVGAEVRISWGTNLLHVEHVDTDKSFYAGETTAKNLACNYFIPENKLGTTRAPLILAGCAVLLPGAAATITVPNQAAMSADEAIALGIATPCAEITGAHQVTLTDGMTVKLQLDDILVEVRGVKKARKVAAAFTMAAVAGSTLLYVLGSFFGHAGLLAAMAAFMPPMGTTGDDEITDDQRYLITQYMESAAEIEKEQAEEELLTELNEGTAGGTGTAAKGASGAMGNPTSDRTDGRFAIKGTNPQPYISKQEALREAADFGMIGLLNDGGGSRNEPTADFGADISDGADALSANGKMWGNEIGDAWGGSGLGLTGIGEGGDGYGEGIGLGSVGTIGHGAGNGCLDCQGFGPGNHNGYLRNRRYKPTAPNPMRQGETKTSGRLPPEVIQRVVRANFGRYRACYQSALKTNPNLQGRVVVNFVIGRSGTVSSANGGGDLPNQGVIGCVASAFSSLTFPQPEHGIVTVSYPLVFSPAN